MCQIRREILKFKDFDVRPTAWPIFTVLAPTSHFEKLRPCIEASPGDVTICFHTWQLKLVSITWTGRRFAVRSFHDNEAYWRDICDVSAPDTSARTLLDMWTCSSAEEFLFPVGKLRKPTRGPSWRNQTSVKVKIMIRGIFTLYQNQQAFNS